MRQRILSPSFFVDEGLVTVSPFARLLFAGLWGIADREGRFEYRPMRIKMLLFPCDEVDVVSLMDELHSIGVVLLYEAEGFGQLGQVVNFLKHQHPHHRESPSILPCHDEKPRAGLGLAPDKPYTSPSVSDTVTVKDTCSEGFDTFWEKYPRRVSKQAALKAWSRLSKADRLAAAESLSSWPFDLREDMRFVPHPATWLNRRRWEDEVGSGSVLPDDD